MEQLYYHQRKKWKSAKRLKISWDFYFAWQMTVNEMNKNGYFAQSFGIWCDHQFGYAGVSKEKLQQALYKELGQIEFWGYDLSKSDQMPKDERLFSFIEFLLRHVSSPIDRPLKRCSLCQGRVSIDFDNYEGRVEFRKAINNLFKQFAHPYELSDGKIIRIDCPRLDRPLLEIELKTDDGELNNLVHGAIDYFFDRSGRKKMDALRKIVDAFERLKTIEEPMKRDKKRSVKSILEKITPEEAVRNALNDDLNDLTKFANEFNIRHSEVWQKQINDEDFVDFYFHLYFNYVRLILKKYSLIQKKKPRKKVKC